MNTFKLDNNNIWVDSESLEPIFFPESGNDNNMKFEDLSFWFRHRNEVILNVINRFPFKSNFADIGGGNGFQALYLSKKLQDHTFFLVEPGYSGCFNAKKRGLENVFNTVSNKFDFIENKVGGVGVFDVIKHIENDVSFLSDLRNRTPEDFHVYITVPAYNFLWSDVDDYGGHQRRYTLKMLKSLASKAGYETVFASYFFSYIPPLTFFLRSLPYKFNRRRNEKQILDTEFRQQTGNTLFNTVSNRFHKFEINRLKKGKKINFGASCVAVLKKR